jgi:hypothetical protein
LRVKGREKLSRKRTNIIFHLYVVPRIGISIETESRIVGSKDREEWEMSVEMGTKFLFGMMRMFWR